MKDVFNKASSDFEEDTRAAYVYLDGYLTFDEREVPGKQYHQEGSEESDHCRAALARVLRSDRPLDRQLREMLADMFDPSPTPEAIWGKRKISVSWRSPKRPKNHFANTHMAQFVWDRVVAGANLETAMDIAMRRFPPSSRKEMSRERMYQLWRAFKPLFEKIYGPIPRHRK